MSTPIKTGVYLRQIETSEDVQVVVKLIRAGEYPDKTMDQFADVLANAPSVTLHIEDYGNNTKLDFDPWSDINVTPDNSIDEKDIAALTKLALVFYEQPVIASDGIVYLYRLPAEPPELRVAVEEFSMGEDDHQLYSHRVYVTKAADSGSPYEVRGRNPVTGNLFDYGIVLNELVKTFMKLKL